jgi:hypothetical protein
VLLVDEPTTSFSGPCRFLGSDSLCGQCLRDKCPGSIDTCCRDSSCAPQLDQCGSGSCGAIEGASSWESCAHESCLQQCGLGVGVEDGGMDAQTDGSEDAPVDTFTPPSTTACITQQGSCSCNVADAPNGVVCEASTVDNGYCCADAGWPGQGSCRCKKMTCETNYYGCECGLVDNGPMQSCQSTTSHPNCCRTHDYGTCICSNKLCESWFGVPVAECSTQTIGCPNNGKRVTSCSF